MLNNRLANQQIEIDQDLSPSQPFDDINLKLQDNISAYVKQTKQLEEEAAQVSSTCAQVVDFNPDWTNPQLADEVVTMVKKLKL